jgi:hypothetical protein
MLTLKNLRQEGVVPTDILSFLVTATHPWRNLMRTLR